MKKLFLITCLVIAVCNVKAQKPATEDYDHRYFEILYTGVDSTGHLKYGTYYFETDGYYFPSKEECSKLIIDGYKLHFSYNDKSLAIIVSEFKTRFEWTKFNHQ